MENLDMADFQVLKDTDEEVEITNALIDKFDELAFLKEIGKVLVVMNNKKKIKEQDLQSGNCSPVSISRVPAKFQDILEQLTGKSYLFVLEIVYSAFFDENDEPRLDINQLKALIYFELRKIRIDFKIGATRTNDWVKILHGLDKEFDRLGNTCQDILDEGFSWEKCLGSYYSSLTEEAD